MKPIMIVGAGMTGLIARAILRGRAACIIERQSSLPDNHHALLRFRSPSISLATGIPFKEVKAIKSVLPLRGVKLGALKSSISYANKTTGRVALRSILHEADQVVDRWIAPRDFTGALSSLPGCDIIFDRDWDFTATSDCPAVWTGPLPTAASALALSHTIEAKKKCRSQAGWSLTVELDPHRWDLYASVISPWPDTKWYRASVTGSRFIVEGVHRGICRDQMTHPLIAEIVSDAMSEAFGLPISDNEMSTAQYNYIPFAKIITADDWWRRGTISSLSRLYNIYSLGRFATWRSDVLLDDLVNDVSVIQRIIDSDEYYQTKVASKT